MTKKVVLTLLVAMLSLLVMNCHRSSDAEQILKDYLLRIEQTVSHEKLKSVKFESKLQPYPWKKSIQQQPLEIRIGFLDFFDFGKCNLQVLIAERNSLLGKMMPESLQLHWEHHFLAKMKVCRDLLVNKDEEDSTFIADLDSIITVKTQEIPKIFWNATFASPEFQKLFSLAARPLPLEGSETNSNRVLVALNYLKYVGENLGEATLTFELDEMEQHYYHLQKERFGGSLLQSMELLSFYLDRVAATIDRQLIGTDKLAGAKDITNLQSAFSQNYRQGVQPYLSKIYQLGDEFLQNINQLYESNPTISIKRFDAYYQSQLSLKNPQGLWHEFKKAIDRHNQAWQRLIDDGAISLH